MSGMREIPWSLLILPCPMIKRNGKLPQPNIARTVYEQGPSGTKAGATPPGKEPQPAHTLAECSTE